MNKIKTAELSKSLRADMDAPTAEFVAYETPYKAATVGNQRYQILFHAGSGRGGITVVGSGSDGATYWTDAKSAEEVMELFEADDMRP